MKLKDLQHHRSATHAALSLEEVAALRLYTTSAFRLINHALRAGVKAEPLPHPTELLYNALNETTKHEQTKQQRL